MSGVGSWQPSQQQQRDPDATARHRGWMTKEQVGQLAQAVADIATVSGDLTSTTVAITDHIADTSDAHDASAISFAPTGTVAATDVQAAIAELDSEKAAASHTHAAGDITSGTLAQGRALVGRLPYAYALEMPEQAAFTTVRTLAAAGGATLFPVAISDWMFVQSLTIHTLNVASARSWEWRLYAEPDAGSATVNEVAGINGTDSFTPGAATNRTSAATTPALVAPGSYWVVLRCTHATNGLDIGTQATGVLSTNHSRIKSGLGALGATLDISTGWTSSTVWVAGRLNGRVAGEGSSF